MHVYRWLLGALPRELREEFGDDMAQLFRDRLDDAGSRRTRVALWVGAIVDVLSVAVATRLPRRLAATPAPLRLGLGDLPMDIRLATRALLPNPTYAMASAGRGAGGGPLRPLRIGKRGRGSLY